MACDQWRELVSAQLDGELGRADGERLEAHLAGCAGCRQWLDRAARVNRLTRTSVVSDVPDLTDAVLAALPTAREPAPAASGPGVSGPGAAGSGAAGSGAAGSGRGSRLIGPLYVLLGGIGAVQLLLGLAQIGGGSTGEHSHAAAGLAATPGHLWHESAAWNVAVGAGFLLVALRRSRPSGLVPMLTAFVVMLLLLSVNDLTVGRVEVDRLISHGFLLLGYLVILAVNRITGSPAAPPTGERPRWRATFGEEPGGSSERPPLRLVRERYLPPMPGTARLGTAPVHGRQNPPERRVA